MASINRLKEGQILYQVVTQKAGNTSIRRKVVYQIKVVSIDLEKKMVTASWNCNKERAYGESQVRTWLVNKPQIKENRWGF